MAPIALELEVRDHIFCDPLFLEHFLAGDKNKLKSVLQTCHKSPVYNKQQRKWTIPRVKEEAQLCQPVQRILNTIKAAVDTVTKRTSMTSFLNRTDRPIGTDFELDSLTRPDLVVFDGTLEHNNHWETVRTTVSIKRLKSHLKAAMAGLAFDARAVFTHQIHRRHLYALAICGSEATFVRFDRSGVLYSTPIDVCSDEFTKAVAGLLMMDDEACGLDTAFSTKMNESRRLDYYVDLPASVLDDQSSGQSTRKFKVVECLCHRMDIIGRATIVLRIRLVKIPETDAPGIKTRGQKRAFQESQPEELHDESYILKLIWRDPNEESEGDIMEQLVGIYGVVQHVWHCDVTWPNVAGRPGCGMRLDETARVEGMLVCKDLTTIENAVKMTARGGGEYKCSVINTKNLKPTSQTRRRRIYSRVLMSSVGKSLWAAESPRELLTGVLDAIMGYWRLVNMGIIHRDISGGNVLLLPPGQNFRRREWREQPADSSEPPSESEVLLREYLETFDRDPTGMLSDFDMYMQLSDSESSGSVKSESPDSTNGNAIQRDRSAGAPEPEGTTAENDSPHSKRRRTEASYMPIHSSNSVPTRLYRTPHRLILRYQVPSSEKVDYRVGTVAFMSVNVLKVPLGERYDHTFMDDLESFFWVLVYTALGHADPGVNTLNPAALKILDCLDHQNMSEVRMFKSGFLATCGSHPEEATETLRAAENGWACDENLVSAVVQLGSFFLDDENVPVTNKEPEVVFPKVVDIILEALEKM